MSDKNVNLAIKLNIPWDYEVRAVTPDTVLVRLYKGKDQKAPEFAVWDYDSEGNCHTGYYCGTLHDAKRRFIERGFPFHTLEDES